MMRCALLLLVLATAACGEFPRDPQGTLDQVRSTRVFLVGVVAPLGEGPADPKVETLLKGVAAASGARPRLESGDMESLLDRLEEGQLDLVVGRFEAKSPWATLVSFSPPLAKEKQGRTEFYLAAAMRNGENAWIGLVEREARRVAPEAQ
jgi:hypothetical protein